MKQEYSSAPITDDVNLNREAQPAQYLSKFFTPNHSTSQSNNPRIEFWNERRAMAVVIIVAVVMMLPMLFQGLPFGGDLYNHFLFAAPFYESLQSGHWYPAWLAESNAGYGDARFRFYPPALYYLLAITRALTGNLHAAGLLAFTLIAIAAALGLYFWARAFLSTRNAMWAGVIYTLVPFHLNELYQAAMLAEYAASAVLPFAFAFVERIARRRQTRDVAGLAISYALLVLTHAPLTVIGSLALLVYALLRMEKGKRLTTTVRLATGVALGLMMSAFYWINMLAELSWIKSSKIQADIYYDYRVNFLFSPSSLVNLNVWYANMLALSTVGLLVPALVLLRRKRVVKIPNRELKAAAIIIVFSLFMATDLSRPLWMILPKLGEVQFPWRWLAIISMCGSIVLAASIPAWIEKARTRALRPLDLPTAISLCLSIFFLVSQVIIGTEFIPRREFEQKLQVIRGRGAASYNYWAPVWTTDVAKVRKMTSEIEAGARSFVVNSWTPERRRFQVAAGDATEARVHTFYYPLWTATTAGGKILPTRPGKDGALLVALPPDATSVELEFREPLRTHIARAVSALGLIFTGLLFTSGLRKRRKGEYDSTV